MNISKRHLHIAVGWLLSSPPRSLYYGNWYASSERSYLKKYLSSLQSLAEYEEVHGDEESRGKVARELAKALRQMEWPEAKGGDIMLWELSAICLVSLSTLGYAEEAYPTMAERGDTLEEVRVDLDY